MSSAWLALLQAREAARGGHATLRVRRGVCMVRRRGACGARDACESGARGAARRGGNGGRGITPPVTWLEDYWMGRYYGMIQAPTTKEKSHLTIDADKIGFGTRADAYDGPDRPDVGI